MDFMNDNQVQEPEKNDRSRRLLPLIVAGIILILIIIIVVVTVLSPSDSGPAEIEAPAIEATESSAEEAELKPSEDMALFPGSIGKVIEEQKTEEAYSVEMENCTLAAVQDYALRLQERGYSQVDVDIVDGDSYEFSASNAEGKTAQISYSAGTLSVNLTY